MRGYSVLGNLNGGFLHGTVEVDLEVVLMTRVEIRTIKRCWREPRLGLTCIDHNEDVVKRFVNLSLELQRPCVTEDPELVEYPSDWLWPPSC